MKFNNDPAKKVLATLEAEGLAIEGWSLRRALKAALDYVRRVEAVSGELKLNPVGQPEGVEAKITLREPGADERKRGYVSADTLLETADQALAAEKVSCGFS
jgi:hypothetical protein